MTKKTDMTDSWMHPYASSVAWESPKYENKTEFFIERCKRLICHGTPGFVDNWTTWAIYPTEKERDEAMAELTAEHPMWHLRPTQRNRYKEQMGIFIPGSHSGINR